MNSTYAMDRRSFLTATTAVAIALPLYGYPTFAAAQEEIPWRHGLSLFGKVNSRPASSILTTSIQMPRRRARYASALSELSIISIRSWPP